MFGDLPQEEGRRHALQLRAVVITPLVVYMDGKRVQIGYIHVDEYSSGEESEAVIQNKYLRELSPLQSAGRGQEIVLLVTTE